MSENVVMKLKPGNWVILHLPDTETSDILFIFSISRLKKGQICWPYKPTSTIIRTSTSIPELPVDENLPSKASKLQGKGGKGGEGAPNHHNLRWYYYQTSYCSE